jgi:hypothetical protein
MYFNTLKAQNSAIVFLSSNSIPLAWLNYCLPRKIDSQEDESWILPAHEERVIDVKREAHAIRAVESRGVLPV